MNVSQWIRRRIAILSLAMAGVEKGLLGQKGENLSEDINQEQRHTQGTLADSLKQGQITQEVRNLRWRTYKVLKATDNINAEIKGYDDKGQPIYTIRKTDKKKGLDKIKLDVFDKFMLEMVVDNSPIVTSGNDAMDNDNIELLSEAIINHNDKGEVTSATHGTISGEQYFATNKSEIPVKIVRENTPKFEIETYTKRLNIRTISKTERLLEFYVSIYPDEYNRRSRFFISDLKKAIENPRTSDMLDIYGVEFVTYKTLGSDDFLEYQYAIKSFDKIVEFNGYYVIKFIAEVVVNGKDILENHREVELDIKYDNKEKKKQ